VYKALRILELLGGGGLRLTDLSSKPEEHKSPVQRLFATLQSRGFVRHNGDNKRHSLWLKWHVQKVSFTRSKPNTITSAKELREEIARIREQGYALDLQEHEEGVRCAAAPIFGLDGRVAGSISVAAPAFRKSEDDILALAPAVMAAARQISDNLGSKREEGREEPA
jgi:DNA-binding IclR family transcriptional regulator